MKDKVLVLLSLIILVGIFSPTTITTAEAFHEMRIGCTVACLTPPSSAPIPATTAPFDNTLNVTIVNQTQP